MIFNVGAGGASTADKVKYDNTESGLQSDNVQGAIDEVNNSLTNEDSETFNFGVKDGVRGFFTDPSRADDSFVPFSNLKYLVKDGIIKNTEITVVRGSYTLNNGYIQVSDNGMLLFKVDVTKLKSIIISYTSSNSDSIYIGTKSTPTGSNESIFQNSSIIDVSSMTGTKYVYITSNLYVFKLYDIIGKPI